MRGFSRVIVCLSLGVPSTEDVTLFFWSLVSRRDRKVLRRVLRLRSERSVSCTTHCRTDLVDPSPSLFRSSTPGVSSRVSKNTYMDRTTYLLGSVDRVDLSPVSLVESEDLLDFRLRQTGPSHARPGRCEYPI